MSNGAHVEPLNELEFSFTDMIREIQDFSRIALTGNFLAPGGGEGSRAFLARVRVDPEVSASCGYVGRKPRKSPRLGDIRRRPAPHPA